MKLQRSLAQARVGNLAPAAAAGAKAQGARPAAVTAPWKAPRRP